LLAAIEAAAEKVLAAFHHQFSVNDHRTRQVDTLHAELTKHRDDLLGRALAPMVKSFVQLHDEMGRAIDRLASKPETEILKEDAMRVLEDFQEEVALALARNDVETYSENNVGHDFDGRRQTVIDHKDAETDEQAGKVAVCLRPGFQSQGVILQKERVVIYRKPVAKQGA
jgi:molecular chaperone GrpE (heat shock protein)